MKEWMFETKLGHFIFIMVFVLISGGIISLLTGINYTIIIIAAFMLSIFVSIGDDNNKWY